MLQHLLKLFGILLDVLVLDGIAALLEGLTGRGRIGSGVLAVDFDFLHLDPPPPFYRTAGPRAERFVKSAAISKRWGRQARACSLLLGCGALEISRA